MIINERTDPKNFLCGHGARVLECQYQFCGYRDLLHLVHNLENYFRDFGRMYEYRQSSVEAQLKEVPSDKLNYTGTWITSKNIIVVIIGYTSNGWKGLTEFIGKTYYFDEKGYEINDGSHYLIERKRSKEQKDWPPAKVNQTNQTNIDS